MSEDQEKLQKALKIMNQPDPVKLFPVDAVRKTLKACEADGFTVMAICFGEREFMNFLRDIQRKTLVLVGDPPIENVTEFDGLPVYKKSTPGFEPLF